MKGSLILLSGLFAGALAIPTTSHVVHEKRGSSTQSRWIKRHALDADTKVPVRIALKQRNLDKGMEYLMEVSDPKSKSYGKHYTKDQVVELFSPDDESIKTVRDWLVSSGIPDSAISVPESRAWVHVDTTVGKLEAALKTRYHAYDHVESRSEHVGTDEYSLPSSVSHVVDFVHPGVAFARRGGSRKERRDIDKDKGISKKTRPMPKELVAKLAANPKSTAHCDTAITPACIKAMYKIPDGKLADSSNRLGVFELDEQKYAQKDLDQFYKSFSPSIPAGFGPKLASIDGGSAPGPVRTAGGEADLDFDIAIPLVYPQGTVLYQTVANNNDIFNTFLDAVDGSYCTSSAYGETGDDATVDGNTPNEQCGAFTPANVISFSYGTAEADYPTYYLQRQCDEFMKLGLQGTTLVMSSGDDGVARRSGPCLGPNQDIFTPDTSANCPYVTAVGSTTLPKGSKVGDSEVATSAFSSGGGFSNIFTTPDYQKNAVASYLANHDPGYLSYQTSNGTIPTDGGIYNSAGRGYPDLAAVGDNGVVVVAGKQGLSGGTSMSAPLVAGIFTRINDERIKAGKGPIGFVNPTLYAHPEMFNDVTVGNQDKGGPDGDSQPSNCGNSGFSAVEGWDPVTGLGTPNYPAFLEVFMGL